MHSLLNVYYILIFITAFAAGRSLVQTSPTEWPNIKNKPPVCEAAKGPYKDCKKAKNIKQLSYDVIKWLYSNFCFKAYPFYVTTSHSTHIVIW
jgi:hypothetical protein